MTSPDNETMQEYVDRVNALSGAEVESLISKDRCPYEPERQKGAIGMFHCPVCGEMVLAGVSHPRNSSVDDAFELYMEERSEAVTLPSSRVGPFTDQDYAFRSLPRSMAAEEAYRAAWTQWCLTRSREMEQVMDALQPQIAESPVDPRWKNFVETLPGYKEFWASLKERCLGAIDELEKKRL